ncbi:hypothetical protein [Tumebacillus permanentifrigoris]|uniref:Uncharacterized protein n=1 Tax=Tumebacillus permanentifrigoris TaxID=378543 RepID=A0A316D6I9_9BACL|nr:hypothetical protein [Tumebacillus permanentifrigoris]PWK03947.1 hypothetical protein C7459_1383 [Tumebacillus permanentifrigoris]
MLTAEERYTAIRKLGTKLLAVTVEEATAMTDEEVCGIVCALPTVVLLKEVDPE